MGFDYGQPIMLVFDCIAKGKHEINTTDGLTLNSVLKTLSRRINTPLYQIGDVSYNYTPLNKGATIRNLGLRSGAVLSVKFKD